MRLHPQMARVKELSNTESNAVPITTCSYPERLNEYQDESDRCDSSGSGSYFCLCLPGRPSPGEEDHETCSHQAQASSNGHSRGSAGAPAGDAEPDQRV